MFANSPCPSLSLEHRKIFTPNKVTNSPTPQLHCNSDHKTQKPRIINEITINNTDKIQIKGSKNEQDYQKNAEFLKKFNILMEKNETLNEVLEKKIRKLNEFSQKNACLIQEIEFLHHKNANFFLELEAYKVKNAILMEEIQKKSKEDHEKGEIIDEFKGLINELEKEMLILKEEDRGNKARFETNERILKEKEKEIEDLRVETMKKQKLEVQFLVFIKENEKLRKVSKKEEIFQIKRKIFYFFQKDKN